MLLGDMHEERRGAGVLLCNRRRGEGGMYKALGLPKVSSQPPGRTTMDGFLTSQGAAQNI
jgi:hypothetical protein